MGLGQRGFLRAPRFACLSGIAAIILIGCQNPFVANSNASNPAQSQGLVSFATPGPVASPVFSPSAGSYSADQSVSVSCGTLGASLYYTTDGTAPTRSSTLYSGPIPVTGNGTSKTIQVLAVKSGFLNASSSASFSINYSQVSTPQFSPPSGSYASDQSISLSCATQGASLYYTIDGTAPTLSSTLYSGPIPIAVAGNGTSKTIRVLAVKTGLADAVGSASYTISYPKAADPQFSPPAGSYSSDQNIALSSATPGASLYYTTDGSNPTISSALYSGPIPVTGDGATKTIKVLVVAAGFTDASGLADYKINYSQVSSPQFTPPAGSYSADQTVSLSCATPGASLYYTIDGSAPTTSSTPYTAGIPVSGNGTSKTIKVLAVKAGFADGGASASYTISYPQVDIPQFSPPPGTYGADITVALSCSTPGAVLYYETGPSIATTPTPTTASTPYSGLIPVAGNPSNLTIKVLAVKAGLVESSTSAIYSISYPSLYIDRIGSGNTFPTALMMPPPSYQSGIPIPIVATPTGGSHFVNWTASGGASVDFPLNSSANVTLSSNGTVTANFALDQYNLAMAVSGNGSTIPSGTTNPVNVFPPTAISATPAPGWHFTGWSTTAGAMVSIPSAASTYATLGADATVTANFSPDNRIAVADSAIGGYIYTSADGGASWTATKSSGSERWGAIAASADGMVLLGSTGSYSSMGDVWRSTDGGTTWSKLSSLGAPGKWAGLACSANGQKIAVAEYQGSGLIHVSSDGGATWSATSPNAYWSSVSWSSDGARLLAGASGASSPLYKSLNGGASWVSCSTSYQWSASRISPDGSRLFGAETSTGSTAGRIWSGPLGGSLTILLSSAVTFYNSIALSSSGTKIAAVDYGAGSGGYIWLSSDSGSTWQQQFAPGAGGLARWNSVSMSLDGTRIVACADDNQSIWISVDGGSTWTTASSLGGGHTWSSVVIQP